MANTAAPRGFQPRKSAIAAPWASTINTYKIQSGYGTTMYANDVAKMLTTGYLAKAAAGDQIRGVVVGFKYTDASGTRRASPVWIAGTVTYLGRDAEVLLLDDPNQTFEAQFVGAGVPTQADVGATFNLIDQGGVVATGLSGEGVDYSTLGTGAQQWRFMGFSTNPSNDATSANSYGLFVPALHDFRVNTGI